MYELKIWTVFSELGCLCSGYGQGAYLGAANGHLYRGSVSNFFFVVVRYTMISEKLLHQNLNSFIKGLTIFGFLFLGNVGKAVKYRSGNFLL